MPSQADFWGGYVLGWVSAVVFWVVRALWGKIPTDEEED